MKTKRNRESGYSLIELLVVVFIIGLISLVGVPNFIVMMRSAKMRTSLTNLSSDLRGARQQAISKNVRTKVSFETGASGTRDYSLWRQVTSATDGTTSWVRYKSGKLEDTVYFFDTNFTDEDDPVDGLNDIVFLPNGTIGNLPVTTAPAFPKVILKTDQKVTPATRSYNFTLNGSFNIT